MFRLAPDVSPVRPTVTVVGRRLDPEHHRLRDFLTRSAQPYEWLEAGHAGGRRRCSRGAARTGPSCRW